MSKDQITSRLATIVSGLLASGHYTEQSENEGLPILLNYDAGPEWKEDGYTRRHQRHVIDHAEDLFRDIEKIAAQIANEQEAR